MIDIADSVDGENDIAELPMEVLRAKLISHAYHPLVVRALPDFAVRRCIRDLIERLGCSMRRKRFPILTRFHRPSLHERPLFGPSSNPPPEPETAVPSFAWSGRPATIIDFPRSSFPGRPLQTEAAPEAKPEKELPTTLPLDLNTKLLNCGVVQTEVDALPPARIAAVMEAFERGLDPEEVVAAVGLRVGDGVRLIADSQVLETTESDANPKKDEDGDDEDDPRRGRF
jgi:hypothetical protein